MLPQLPSVYILHRFISIFLASLLQLWSHSASSTHYLIKCCLQGLWCWLTTHRLALQASFWNHRGNLYDLIIFSFYLPAKLVYYGILREKQQMVASPTWFCLFRMQMLWVFICKMFPGSSFAWMLALKQVVPLECCFEKVSGSEFWGWVFQGHVYFRLLPFKISILGTIMGQATAIYSYCEEPPCHVFITMMDWYYSLNHEPN